MASFRRPKILLELDLTALPVEVEPDDLLGRLRTRHRPRLRAVLRTLHEAGGDTSVTGLIVKVGGAGLPWATMQELRDGLLVFARSGKPTVAWAETLGEGSSGSVDYVLATGCTEIRLQPTAELGLVGVASETTFLRGALDKVGVEPQIDKRHEYKNAADRIMRTEFTDAHREAIDRLVESTWQGALEAIASARGLDATTVEQLSARAPLGADEAVEAGLVDSLGYRDEIYADMRAKVGGDVELLFADQWTPRRRVASLVTRSRDFVAVVDAQGDIVGGRSKQNVRGRQIGSDTVGAALRAARENDHARAVLFRIDSPGGSAVASDTIWREVTLVRAAGKPVIVSMGAVAGSGGYFIACPADVIVAQPATITGSIGVFGGKIVVSGLLEKLGLTTGAVEHGGAARMFSTRRGFTDDEQGRLAAMLDRIYTDFVQKVADGRSMTYDAVHEVARGRVWTGSDASANGLVDVLGGARDAAAIAREKGGLAADAPLRPAVQLAPLARLGRPHSSEDPRALAAAAMSSPWGDLAALAEAVGLPGGGPLRMPTVRLR